MFDFSASFLTRKLFRSGSLLFVGIFTLSAMTSAFPAKAEVRIGDTWCYDNPLRAFVGLTSMFSRDNAKFFFATYLNNIDETKKPKLEITPQGQAIINEWSAKNPLDEAAGKLFFEQRMKLVSEDEELQSLFLEAGEFQGVSKQSKVSKCLVWIHVTGKITQTDVEKVATYLAGFKRQPYVRATLDSVGGEVSAAIALGRLFREHLGTVDMTGSCLSACVLVYASGIGKLMGFVTLSSNQRSKIGVHHHFLHPQALKSLSLQESLSLLDDTEKQIVDYLDEMGADAGLMKLAKSTLPEDIYYLNGEELRTLLPHVLSNYLTVIEQKTKDSNFYFTKLQFELFLRAIEHSDDWKVQVKWLGKQLKKIKHFDEWRMGPMNELRMARALQYTYQ